MASPVFDPVLPGEGVSGYGGDDFVVFMQDPESVEDLAAIAAEIRRDIAKISVCGIDAGLFSVSIGNAVFPGDECSLREMIDRAGVEMVRDKQNPIDRDDEPAKPGSGSSWEKVFSKALVEGPPVPYFQPLVDVAAGRSSAPRCCAGGRTRTDRRCCRNPMGRWRNITTPSSPCNSRCSGRSVGS